MSSKKKKTKSVLKKRPVAKKSKLSPGVLTLFRTWDHMGDLAQHEDYQLTFDVLNSAVTAIAKKMKKSRGDLIDLYRENLKSSTGRASGVA